MVARGCLTFVLRIEVRNMIADSSKPNKLQNVYTNKKHGKNVTVQNRKNNYIKIKVIALVINFRRKKFICNLKRGFGIYGVGFIQL